MSKTRDKVNRFFDAADKLHEFKDPDEIANFLRDLGYKGVRQEAESCPLARFVKDCIGDPDAIVCVDGFDMSYRWENANGKPERVESRTDDTPVAAFVTEFDRGGYPELETEAEALAVSA